MARLDDCERQIVYLTYFEGWTQREIGVRLGLGQVQVSRRLRSALDRLRAAAEAAHTTAA
jgi:RNA polymerase sigma-B factor